MSDNSEIRVGCQSWGYEDWITKPGGDTVFYPRGTKSGDMLELYSAVFDTIEVDSTAYGVPAESMIEGWYEKSTPNFKFSLKAPRLITHELSLSPASYPVFDEFLERLTLLREKLGAVLIQLPASFESTKENAQAVRGFVERLPSGFKFALEFREPGWFIDWTFEEFEKNNVALALVEGKWVDREKMFEAASKSASKLCYVRFMGERDLLQFDKIQRPRDEILMRWSKTIAQIEADAKYIYMDNYFEGFAPGTANKMKQMLDLSVTDFAVLDKQPSLF
jgi:uncharacterized protein YecE (DUF72 family)